MNGNGDSEQTQLDVLQTQMTEMREEFDSQRASLMQMYLAVETQLKERTEENEVLRQQLEVFLGPGNLDMEEVMRNAENQNMLLRSVVKPMEEEINTYKTQISLANEELKRLREYCDNKKEDETSMKEELSQQIKAVVLETRNLGATIVANDQELINISVRLSESDKSLRQELAKVTKQLEKVAWQNRQLTEDNDRLLAKHCSKMEQRLAAEALQLPVVFEKTARLVEHDENLLSAFQNLQFEYLKLHGKMIESMVTWENADEKLRAEVIFLQEQHNRAQEEQTTCKESLSIALQCQNEREQQLAEFQRKLNEAQERIACLELIEPLKIKFEKENHELRCIVATQKRELDDSEAVQKDFVKLSQTLQVELEKLRVCDAQVRFQHPDDVQKCGRCENPLSSSKKQNCRHCGLICCSGCISKTVKSGPNNRSFNVCEVCHTLLDKTSAPYFSSQ